MNFDDASQKGPAQRALFQILRRALPEGDKCQRAIRDALLSAGMLGLPADPEELLRFVRAHLAPQLSDHVSPRLVLAFIHDLAAEIEHLGAAEDPPSASRIKPARCIDLKRAHIDAGIGTKEDCGALLEHLAYIAEPGTGAPTMLLVFARMATTACVWLDGDLRIELRRDRETIWIDVLTELGGSMGERVFPSIAVHVPFDEFLGAIERVPQMVKPLSIRRKTDDRLTLGASAYVRRTSKPTPMVSISDASVFAVRRDRG